MSRKNDFKFKETVKEALHNLQVQEKEMLFNKNVAELEKLAEENNIEGHSEMTISELIDAIYNSSLISKVTIDVETDALPVANIELIDEYDLQAIKLRKYLKRFLALTTAGVIALACYHAGKHSKTNDKIIKDLETQQPTLEQTVEPTVYPKYKNEENVEETYVFDDEKAIEIATDIKNDFDKLEDVNYSIEYIADMTRISHNVAPLDETLNVDDYYNYFRDILNKQTVNAANALTNDENKKIGLTEEDRNIGTEIFLSKHFEPNTMDRLLIENLEQEINAIVLNPVLNEKNGEHALNILRIFYDVYVLNGKQTELGIITKNNLTPTGIYLGRRLILSASPLIAGLDLADMIEYEQLFAVDDHNKEELEVHGYNNLPGEHLNLIRQVLNPIPHDDYLNYFDMRLRAVFNMSAEEAANIIFTHDDEEIEGTWDEAIKEEFAKKLKVSVEDLEVKTIEYFDLKITYATFIEQYSDFVKGSLPVYEDSIGEVAYEQLDKQINDSKTLKLK